MSDFFEKTKQFVDIFENELESRFDMLNIVEPLGGAMRYSLFSEGKRIRPILCLATSKMLNGDFKEAINFAIAIELIHTYSLIHDDMPCMDNDSLRRGKSTNHIIYGEAMAMLAGDSLLNLAYEILFSGALSIKRNENYLKACYQIASLAGHSGMIKGQTIDITLENATDIGENEVMQMHYCKTAKLLIAAVVSSAISQGATSQQIDALTVFAENLGLAFQVKDDILDVINENGEFRLENSKDYQDGKLTFIKVFGFEKSKLLCEDYTKRAIESLSIFGDKAVFLKQMAEFLLERKF